MKTFTAFKAKFRVSLTRCRETVGVLPSLLSTVGLYPRPSNVMPRRYFGYRVPHPFTANPSERQESFNEVGSI